MQIDLSLKYSIQIENTVKPLKRESAYNRILLWTKNFPGTSKNNTFIIYNTVNAV